MSKQVTLFQAAEKNYQESMESTIAKARDTYRKYDAYLENAEDAVLFAWTFALGTLDLIDHIFESLIRESETDLTAFFRKDINEEADNKRKNSIEKLAKSEFLKKKRLFLEIERLLSIKEELDFRDKQAKFDRLATLIAQGTQPRSAINIIRPLPAQEPASMNSGSHQADLKELPNKNGNKANDSFVQSNLTMLTQNIIAAKQMIDNHPNANVEQDVLRELIARTNEFITSIQNYFFNLKTTGSFIDDSDSGKDGTETPLFSMENLERALARIGALEKVEIERLMDLRNKNERLRGVQAHIKQRANKPDR
jgi:hypothetical protein